jgi:hypothetical protein
MPHKRPVKLDGTPARPRRVPVPAFDHDARRLDRSVVCVVAVSALSAALVLQHAPSNPVPPAQQSALEDGLVTEPGAGGNGVPLFPEPPTRMPDAVALPALETSGRQGPGGTHPLPAMSGIPATVLSAYQDTADDLGRTQPGCQLSVPLLAAIGRVESGHARGGNVDAHGATLAPILGPRLDGGPGVAAIRDTDGGRYDGDTTWDRAVGPMQFIPSTWRRWGSDGNADGTADPHNVFDAALSAGRYLCAAGGGLATPEGLRRAILAYNHSESYLHLVLAWMRVYQGATTAVPDMVTGNGESAHGSTTGDGEPAAESSPKSSSAGDERPQDEQRAAAPPAPPPVPEQPSDPLPRPGDGDDTPEETPEVPGLPTSDGTAAQSIREIQI